MGDDGVDRESLDGCRVVVKAPPEGLMPEVPSPASSVSRLREDCEASEAGSVDGAGEEDRSRRRLIVLNIVVVVRLADIINGKQ